jgi:hypothetical protein
VESIRGGVGTDGKSSCDLSSIGIYMGSLALSIQSINSYSSYMKSETPICSTQCLSTDEHDCLGIHALARTYRFCWYSGRYSKGIPG